jgi:hypothetical protein
MISKALCTVLLTACCLNVWAFDINEYLSGSWWNSSQNGHGFSIEVLDDGRTVIYWYVYNPDGTSTFLLTVGDNTGNRTSGKTYYYSGMKFGEFNPSMLQETVWGNVSITFHDCNNATLQYSSSMSHLGVPFGSGTIPLQKAQEEMKGLHCTDSPLHGNYHMTFTQYGQLGFGLAALFSNGDMAYFAVGTAGAEAGLGAWWQTGSKSFSFNATAYDAIDGGTTNFSGSGESGEDGFGGEYLGSGVLIGTRVHSFQKRLTTNMIAGNYTAKDIVFDANVGTITIATNGQVTGKTDSGCDLSGTVSIPDRQFNQAYFDVTQSNCSLVARIVGAGTYFSDERSLLVIGSDGLFGYIWELR